MRGFFRILLLIGVGFRFVHALIAIIKDISSFCIVLTIVLISFGQALQNVLSPDDGHDDGRFSSASSTAVSMFSLILADFEEDEYGANLWARLFFVAFMLLGVIVLLNVLIAIVSDSYMDAQQRSRNLFAVTRLHLAAEMLLVMPTWMFADAGYVPARGNMTHLLFKKSVTRMSGKPVEVGGIRDFCSSHGYGRAGLALLVSSITLLLPITAIYGTARFVLGRLVGSDKACWFNPESLLKMSDIEVDEVSSDFAAEIALIQESIKEENAKSLANQQELSAQILEIRGMLANLPQIASNNRNPDCHCLSH